MLRRILTIARKELMHVRRDRRTLAAIFAMPLIQLLLFSYALSFDVKNIGLAVLDQDRSQQSRRLIDSFTNSGYFQIRHNLDAYQEIDDALDSGAAKVALVIPTDFSRQLAAGRKSAVQVLIDGSESNAAIVARGYADGIIRQFSQNLRMQTLTRRGLAGNAATLAPLELRSRLWYNASGNSTVFILPGLIVIIMVQIAVMQTALAVVREKDHGTIEQLIVSPVRSYELMIGKILPFMVMALIDLVLVTAVGVAAFGMPVRGSLVVIALGSLLFVLAALGLGLFVSSVAGTMETASQLSLLLAMLPSFVLSGFFWPIENMPAALRLITYMFPARYFLALLRGLFLRGAGVSVLWGELLALSVFTVVSIGLAALNLKERTG